MKLTKMEPRDNAMPKNEHEAATYGEWCKKEVERIGSGAYYVEEYRDPTINGEKQIVTSETPRATAWCRVDRI